MADAHAARFFFAGQVSGVEGYVESAASGLIAGRNAAALALGEAPAAPPRTTAIGALAYYVSHAEAAHYQPTNITFGIMPPLEERPPAPKKAPSASLPLRRVRSTTSMRGLRRRAPVNSGRGGAVRRS